MPQGESPDIREVLAVAVRHHQAGRLSEAERLYRQILQADPRHADALHFLGVLAHQVGRNDDAVDLIGKAIAHNGRMPAFHNNLGNALKAQGKLQEAADSYARSLSLKADNAEAHYNLGVVLQAQEKLTQAAASYGRALSYRPNHVAAHTNLGNVLQAQGRSEEAIVSYRRALALKPDYAPAHGNLGNVLKAQGKLSEAVATYEKALALEPDYVETHNSLGLAFLELGRLDQAVASCRRALSLEPEYAEAHTSLGNALREQGRLEEATASYRRAVALRPQSAPARLGLAVAAIPVFAADVAESSGTSARFTQALDELAAWNSDHPGKLGQSVGSHQPFYLAYRPFEVGALLARYGDLMCAAAAATHMAAAATRPRSETDASGSAHPARDRVRVVIINGQVRQHPVWVVVLRGIIAHLDRTRFEIVLYHTGSLTDGETDWAKNHVDRFVQGPKALPAWLDEARRDRPDVMFYPEVGMDPATCALAALRLAPLQIAGWGHPVTTGLPSMDLFVSAQLLEGPGAEKHYCEKLVRLPGTGVCTETSEIPTEVWEAPDRRRDTVRFALCQQPIKFDPADDALYAQIAKAVGPCEFWLASDTRHPWATAKLRDRLTAAFRAAGLDPDVHLRVTPWLPRDQFSGFLDEMDVYLDCPAFSGYTTAWQAIHRGAPIVTLEGEFLRQRLAAGLLRQIGIIDGIAASREQYVQIAIRWAEECRQSDQREARRAAIRGAAPRADGNRSAVSAFEETLLGSLRGRQTSSDTAF